jgi:hypothetical protein
MAGSTLQAGIQILPGVEPPSGYTGTSTWVQVIGYSTLTFSFSNGQPQYCQPQGNTTYPALDAAAPYPFGYPTYMTDAPGVPLPAPGTSGLPSTTTQAQQNQVFQVTLLWQPQTANGIGITGYPVPLASIAWNWVGTASWSGSSWVFQPGGSSISSSSPATGNIAYPDWGTTLPADPTYTSCYGIRGDQ